MAEFKLGRIRFIWKGDWVTGTTYIKDDIVKYGGKTYVCVIGHTADADFYVDFENDPARWNQLSDGQQWKGDWQTEFYYKQNDIVKYGGYLYICNDGHTSAVTDAEGLEVDQSKWDLFGETFDWKADWAVDTRYKVNDVVKYGGNLYLCNEGHTSASTLALGLEDSLSKWDIYSESFDWKGEWDVDTRYKINDVVTYGGTSYVCNEGHTSAATETLGLEDDQSKWDYLHKGIEYLGDWSGSSVRYKINDVVKWGADLWICTTQHTSSGTFAESNWSIFVEGLEFDDSWNESAVYQPGDVVTYGGYAYISKTNNTNQTPTTNSDDWSLFTTGFAFKGDWGNPNSYEVGDVVRLNGYTYVATADNTNQKPPNTTYWQRLNYGMRWFNAWASGQEYTLGDSIRYGSNSYICINPHTSATGNRPDNDTTGTYWNLLAAGSEESVLTTQGDLVYYGGAGATRLPIGRDGQILRVNGFAEPTWAYFGVISDVYYVAPNGADEPFPAYGATIDKPWKTVRYACEQIERGAKNQMSAKLLEINRQFIQAEIIEWIDAQIVGNIAPFTSAFTYDSALCERDMGYLVDALIWDITHGGNVRSRLAALSYFTDLGSSYITGQEEETVAAINYGLTLIDDVISNVAVTPLQTTIDQIIDTDLIEETGVQDRIDELVGIITDAITAGETTNIPAAVKTNVSLNVKTGTYYEVLPIVVPAETAIIGDELRSTNIRPAGSLVDASDVQYSVEGLTRIASLLSDVVQGTSVTKTPSNTQSQVAVEPFASITDGAEAEKLMRAVVQAIAYKTQQLDPILTLAEPTGYNVSYLIGYGDARDLIVDNKAFIQAEILAYIEDNYPNLYYDRNACSRDVGYIIDALRYDMTYGGNLQTLVAANSYFAGVGGASQIDSTEVTATLAAYAYLQSLVGDIAVNTTVTPLQTDVAQVSGTAGSAGAATFAEDRIGEIITTIDTGTAPSTSTPSTTWVSGALTSAQSALNSAKTTIQNNVTAWIDGNVLAAAEGEVWYEFTYNSTKCARDVGQIIDALGYDFMFDSNFQSIKAAMAYLRTDASVVLTEQKQQHLLALEYLRTEAIANVGSDATAIARINANMEVITDIIFSGSYEGTNTATYDGTLYAAARLIELNKDFLAEEATAYITATYPSYTYDVTACQRDVREFLDAIKYDLVYTGNYRSRRAATHYAHAVNGSTLSDMFYLQNGTGLRNCTVQGLTGYLGPVNGYGTRRPTAGAFVSLDPGWGPDDNRAWIINKSPYVQNVTTFGTACVGQKIDGSLHNGGNKSIVSNDFTQVLSDGIGCWVKNDGRVELVSVFSYYGHIGYLAEDGGKIRATNGNSSYGTYGCVSEGVDLTETPITGVVTNRAFDAVVEAVNVTGEEVMNFEFLNAGQEYTTATYTVSGAGYNLSVSANEFRDGGVTEIRLTDPGDSSGTGGADYNTQENVAQGGNTTSITIAATDSAISSAYTGMRISIVSGTGVGQYGYINSYNAGSKLAQVYKISTGTAGWDHVIPGTAIASALDATTQYRIEPRVTITSPGFTSTSRSLPSSTTWSDAIYGEINFSDTGIATTGGTGTGATFDVDAVGLAYTVELNNGGTGYIAGDLIVIDGSDLGGSTVTNDITVKVGLVDSITGAVEEFTVESGIPRGGRFVAVSGGTAGAYSDNGTTWTSTTLPSATWTSIANGDGRFVAVATGSTTSAYSDDGITWTTGGSMPSTYSWSSVVWTGTKFLAIAEGGQTASSTDGTTWAPAGTLPITGTAYKDLVYGKGKLVAIDGASGTTVGAISSNEGTTWSAVTLPAGTWTSITFGKNLFIAVGESSASYAYSQDGTTWSTGTLPSTFGTAPKVAYGQGLFFVVQQGSATAATSEDGTNWTGRSLSSIANWSAVAFGNPSRSGVWAQISTGATTANSVATGCTAMARVSVASDGGTITAFKIVEPGSGYTSDPTVGIIDPSNTVEATFDVRLANGTLANPTFNNRGSDWASASATLTGDGFMDRYQTGSYINVRNLTSRPVPGSNVRLTSINDVYYKLVAVTNFLGTEGNYTATLQLSPTMGAAESPAHNEAVDIRILYSQVRLTGHDFLSIGTGNFAQTNYPGLFTQDPVPANETVENGGGRVFYTSTDQDGNFRVGGLFNVEQATGVATLNADAFNISGLQELQLGSVALGGTGATINEFSTDPYFTADSDSVVPTQRAIKAYIASQIGGGGSSLNVNTLTAGVIYVANDEISTTTGVQINIPSKMNFLGGVDGTPVALNFFLLG